jgi:hypothetical protein
MVLTLRDSTPRIPLTWTSSSSEHGEEDHAQPRAEVAAVDRRDERAHQRGGRHRRAERCPAHCLAPTGPQSPGQDRLRREQRAGQQHEHGRDVLEQVGRRDEQQHGAREPTGERERRQRTDPGALRDDLAPEPGDTTEVAGPDADAGGDVGHDRRVPDGEQSREGDQRPAAGDAVDQAGPEAGRGEEERVAGQVRAIPAAFSVPASTPTALQVA